MLFEWSYRAGFAWIVALGCCCLEPWICEEKVSRCWILGMAYAKALASCLSTDYDFHRFRVVCSVIPSAVLGPRLPSSAPASPRSRLLNHFAILQKNNESWPRHTDIRRKRPRIRVFRRIVPCPCPQSMPSPFFAPLVTASRIYLPMISPYAFFAFLALFLQACSSAASTTKAHLIPSVNTVGLAEIALPTHALEVFSLSSIVCNDSFVSPSEGVGNNILSCPINKPMTLLRPRSPAHGYTSFRNRSFYQPFDQEIE